MPDGANERTHPYGLTWFPLIFRPRPPGLPLETRIAELDTLATQSESETGHQRASMAAEACNKAALIASDCAMPDLARELCHQQYTLFANAAPLALWAAPLAVQPLLNLARQLIREGDGDGAYAMLESLDAAARRHTHLTIDGSTVDLAALTQTPQQHDSVIRLIWAALLADGTRALAVAGRWREAADRAAQRRGIGNRLLDGRQATVLALVHEHRTEQATELIDNSVIVEPWEHLVQSILRVLSLKTANGETRRHRATMLTSATELALQQHNATAVSCTRAALIALALAHDSDQVEPLQSAVISIAVSDAYAARDLLTHPDQDRILTVEQRNGLNQAVRVCGLGARELDSRLKGKMASAVERAQTALLSALQLV